MRGCARLLPSGHLGTIEPSRPCEDAVNDDQLDLGASFEKDAPQRDKRARVAVCELVPGCNVECVYLLAAKESRTTKAGKPFFKLRLSDRTGSVDCMVWETDSMQAGIDVGDLVCATARVTEYQGKPQLEASRILPAPPGAAEARDFLPSTYRDIEELKGFLRFHIDSVYDRDLLLTAALLHDIGKTQELSYDVAIDYTDSGRFLGHVIQGVTLVSEKAKQLPSFPDSKLQQLLHCIVSHHGELEWGSPKRPKTIEALVLHHVDNLDAKVKGFLEIVDGSRDASWTDLRNLFRRPLHVPRATHQEDDFLPPGEDEAGGFS